MNEGEASVPQRGEFAWFDINAYDRDNLTYHLANTPAQEAWLTEQSAHWEREYLLLNQQADDKEAEVWKNTRMAPVERVLAKGGVQYVDASEDVCKFFARCHPVVQDLRRRAIEARYKRDLMRGYEKAMATKKVFLATLGGLTRQEMSMMQGDGV